MKAIELITAALKELGVVGAGETPSSDLTTDALSTLNLWIDSLGTERLTMFKLTRTTKTLAASTASYTVGTGGSINITRPLWIEAAGLVLDTTASTPTEIPISVFTDQEYAGIPQKTLTATQPSGIYYDHGWTSGLGIIYPLPIPTVGTTQLVLYTPTPVSEFADLSATDYTFPAGYRRALTKGLAIELAPQFGASISDLLVQQAAESMADVKRSNFRLEELSIDPAYGPQGRAIYNIYTGP